METILSTPADRIVFLSLARESRILSVATDGSDLQVLVDGLESKPDGITIDAARGHMYYTFMGIVRDGEDFWAADGHIERADLDGGNRRAIVPVGGIVTGKQISFDPASDRIYWCDREGLRVMSCRRDGSDLRVHVQTGTGEQDRQDRRRHPVGVAIDSQGGYLYWTQKGKPNGNEGSILRAPLAAEPADPAARDDIEVLLEGLPEPIDLEWAGEESTLYWTDRGDPPNGNTVNRARIRGGQAVDHEILLSGLQEGIGLAHDPVGRRVFFSDLAGHLRVVSLDHPHESRVIFKGEGRLTGIAYLRRG